MKAIKTNLIALVPGLTNKVRYRDFDRWLTSTEALKPVEFTGAQVLAEHERFLKEASDPKSLISVSDFIPPTGLPRDTLCTFGTLALPEKKEPFEICGLKIRILQTKFQTTLRLRECFIDSLEIRGPTDIEAHNCCIRRISFTSTPVPGTVGNLQWTGGFLGHLKWGTGAEPFRGDVSLSNIGLPRCPTKDGIQWLRDTRTILLKKNNQRAASFFHAAELAQERGREPIINRVASHLYELGSDFGNSISRPLLWLTFFFLVINGLALSTGTEANTIVAIGWRTELATETELGKVLRASVYALQSIFNPLNLFDSRPLVTVRSWFIAMLCGGLGILGTMAFTLFILSLRRRFRLE